LHIFVRYRTLPPRTDHDYLLGEGEFIEISKVVRRGERLLDYKQTVDVLDEMIVVVSPEYRYVLANRAYLNYKGMERERVVGHLVSEIVNPEAFEGIVKEKLNECFQGGVVNYEMKYRCPYLGERDLLISHLPIEGRNGIRRAACVLRDVTQRKLEEKALYEAQTNLARVTRLVTMGEMVASIAHEVNQPLTAILTTGKVVQREIEGERPNLEAVQEAIKEMVEDGTRISDIISRIRAFVKKEPPDLAGLDINYVIREAALIVSKEAAGNDVQVRLDLATELPGVLGDRVQLQQVLINLAINGIDAMRTIVGLPRDLVIKSAAYGNDVLIQVQDSGVGLDADRTDWIFQPFFTTKEHGMGMGLPISRSIIEFHGGRLWAEPGSAGAVFQFTLPACPS
jgi:PAS domain S-box-containing protein